MQQVREQIALFTPAGPQAIQLWANNATQELAALAQEFGFRLNRVAPLDGSENFTSQVTFEAGIKILDSTGADSVVFSHDGADFNTVFTNTTDWNLTSLAVLKLFDGCDLQIFDSTDTDSALFSHDGADFNTAFTGTTDWNITGLTNIDINGSVDISGGLTMSGNGQILADNGAVGVPSYSFLADADSGLHGATAQVHVVISGVRASVWTATRFLVDMPVLIKEQAAASSTSAGFGQLWVRNDAPNTLMFTNDGGSHFTVNVTAV